MNTRPVPHLFKTLPLIGLLLVSVPQLSAATSVWDGGAGTNDLISPNNWNPNGVPSGDTNGNVAQWNGTPSGDLSLVFSDSIGNGTGFYGLDLSLTALQVGNVTINSSVAAKTLRIRNVAIASGAGAFSVGAGGDAMALYLGNATTGDSVFTNNSSQAAILGSQITTLGTGFSQSRTLTFAGSGNWNVAAQLKVTGAETFTLRKNNAGTLTLSGANTYNGPTTVNGGTLQFAKQASLYNNTSGSWTAANLRVASGATLAFNVGGTDEFTTGNVTTLLTNLAASSSATNGMNAGSFLGFDTTNASGGTFTISDVIANTTGASGGARGLVKLGTGNLILSGTNTYSGATVISAGQLVLAHSNALGTSTANIGATGALSLQGGITVSNAINITAGAAPNDMHLRNLTGNNLLSGPISITGSSPTLTRLVSEGGQLTIQGNITRGTSTHTLVFQGDGNIRVEGDITGNAGSVSRSQNGTGTIEFVGAKTFTSVMNINGPLTIDTIANGGTASGLGASSNAAGNILFSTNAGNGGTLRYTGATASTDRNFTITNNALNSAVWDITQAGTTLTVSGGASQADGTSLTAGNLRKEGAGRLIFSGQNLYTGTTTLSAGTLQFATQASLYNNTSGSWTTANIRVASGATLAFNVGGAGEFTTGNVTTLLTNLAASSSATNGMNAGSSLGFDTSNASGIFTISDVIANTTGASGGTRGVVKLGTGTLTLGGTNTYTGSTLVTAGTLVIDGNQTAATGAVTVSSGATLAGSGTVGGATTIAGHHSPGNSPGVQNFASNLTYTNGSSVTWELIGNTTANRGINFDGINVVGGLTITGTSTINLVFNLGGSTVLWADTFWDTDKSWLFYDVVGSTSGAFALGSISVDSMNQVLGANRGSFSIGYTGSDVTILYTAIPEPSTTLLLTAGLMAVVLLLRRRARS